MAKGYVDRLDYCGVAGWVVDDSAPQRPIQVDVLLRGRFCARVPADMFRGDVQQAGHGDGVSGFRFVFPQTLPDEDVAEIAVVTSHSGAAIERSNPMSSFAETLYCGGAFIGSYAADNRQPASAFLSAHYQRHNQRRLEHLASLGLPLASRSVLEAGAGIGDHTSFFLDRGCRVLACEARAENLRLLEERFANHPARERLTTERLDLDDPVPAAIAPHEVVYAYGLLYHLSRPAEALQHLAGAAARPAPGCGRCCASTSPMSTRRRRSPGTRSFRSTGHGPMTARRSPAPSSSPAGRRSTTPAWSRTFP